MRLRNGTKSLRGGKVLVKSATTMGIRKMTCPGCKKLVGPSTGQNGQPIYRCACGRSFATKLM